jgi:DNA end-binding protein Ku
MAQRLVDEMTVAWDPKAYHDTYREDLLQRIEARIAAGETHELAAAPAEAQAGAGGAQIIDLMTALRESLSRKGPGKTAAAGLADREAEDADDGAEPQARPPAPNTQDDRTASGGRGPSERGKSLR